MRVGCCYFQKLFQREELAIQQAFAEMLHHNRTIQRIDLSSNRITSSGAQAPFELQSSETLEILRSCRHWPRLSTSTMQSRRLFLEIITLAMLGLRHEVLLSFVVTVKLIVFWPSDCLILQKVYQLIKRRDPASSRL